MLDWAAYRKGSLAAWIRSAVEGLLAPYRPIKRRKSRATRRVGAR